MRLDDIVSGHSDFRVVIDGIASMAEELIAVLQKHQGSTVDLGFSPLRKGAGVANSGAKTAQLRAHQAQRRPTTAGLKIRSIDDDESGQTARPFRKRRHKDQWFRPIIEDGCLCEMPGWAIEHRASPWV
jgi:hypothetical protein